MKHFFLNLLLIIIYFSISEQTSFAIEKNICLEGNSFINNNKIFIINEKKPFNGKDLCFYESGNIKYEMNYIGGKKHGTETYWYDKKGFRKSIVNFSNGIKQGIHQTWNQNGILTTQVFFKDNLIEGTRLVWYEFGEKKLEHNYVKGKKNGKLIRWYKNGNKKLEGQYLDGFKNGLWMSWYQNGNIKAKGKFDKGVPLGTHYAWYSNGQKKIEAQFSEGKLNGKYTYWDNKRKVIDKLFYKNGICEDC